jgi:hypothetical protein
VSESESVRALSEALDAGDALNLAGGSRNAGEAGPERDARNRRNWHEASSRWYEVSHRLRALIESGEPASDGRLIDTKPPLGGLAETIELELSLHTLSEPDFKCNCGNQIDGEWFDHHLATAIDYRLTATDGDA